MIRSLVTITAFLIALAPLSIEAQDEDELLRGIERVTGLLAAIEQNYYDSASGQELVDSAIKGMLSQLDPHSNYISPEEIRQLQSQQQGEYYGVGMTVGYRDGKVVCVEPQEGGPAAEAGLKAGDVLVAIDGEATEDYEYTENVERLRGPRGTSVTITVRRPGVEKPLSFTVIRDRINLKSIPYAFMIDDQTGYIRINSFSHTTDKEMEEQLLKLNRRGMKRLLLDLRSNPGGDLDASVAVADMFIDDGKLVYTKGASQQVFLEYTAEKDTTLFRGPLVVLINQASASGSEVVAGALQDHDRAWVVGEKSWGKGLVQTQFPLTYGAVLSLTTAKYYTPSGRLIQKPYEPGSFDQYFDADSGNGPDTLDAATTDLGRVVYGGNGIMPDQRIEGVEFGETIQQIVSRGLIFNFINEMLTRNPEISADFYAAGSVMSDFRSFLAENGIEYTDDQWKQDRDFLAARVTMEAHRRERGAEYGFRMVLDTDKQLQEALNAFDKARDLLARRVAELQE